MHNLGSEPRKYYSITCHLPAFGQPTPVDTSSNLSGSNGPVTIPLCPHKSSTSATLREFLKGKDPHPIHQIHQPPQVYTAYGGS